MVNLTSAAVTALVAAAVAAASATVARANGGVAVNTATTVATASNAQLVILGPSGPIPVTVARLSGRVTITSSGGMTIPIGAVSFGASSMPGGSVTVTQTAAWTGQLSSLLSPLGTSTTGVLALIVVPSNGIRVQGIGNDFYMGGAFGGLAPAAASLQTLFTISGMSFTNSGLQVLALRVTRVNGTNLGLLVGMAGGLTANVSFLPAITLAAV
jgi:hypothetical protein